jgi:hypothetical protein
MIRKVRFNETAYNLDSFSQTSEIYNQNQRAKVEGRPTINLQSVLISNGITGISTWVILVPLYITLFWL